MDKKSFIGLILAAVFCLIVAGVCINELLLAVRNGYIKDPVNRGQQLSERVYVLMLILYSAAVIAAGGLGVYFGMQIVEFLAV
ncbi:MAG: hypothetical protein U5R06_21670 [candidate division KSB1 bacterium]|nr:hypothetical protein [candidate division KSB1 bacterium]